MLFFFFFKQKTAYEMRISDWSSDVCSSDLKAAPCMIALLLGAALTLTIVYLRAKQRADAAYPDQLGARERCAPFALSSVRCSSQSARLLSRRAPSRPGLPPTANS